MLDRLYRVTLLCLAVAIVAIATISLLAGNQSPVLTVADMFGGVTMIYNAVLLVKGC